MFNVHIISIVHCVIYKHHRNRSWKTFPKKPEWRSTFVMFCWILISNFPHFNLKFTIRDPTPTPTWVIFYWTSTDKSITDFPAHLVSQPFWIFPFARPTEVNGISHQGVTIPVHKVGIGRWLRERISRLPGQAGVPESWPQEAISTHRSVQKSWWGRDLSPQPA